MIGGVAAIIGSVLLYRATRSTAKGTETIEGVKVVIDGYDRLHDAEVAENERLRAALIEERAVSQTFATKADRLEAENVELRARLAEREER